MEQHHSAPTKPDDARLETLKRYRVLASPPEKTLSRVVRLAANIFDVPTALVTFLDDEREWIQAEQGFDRDVLPHEVSFGIHAVQSQDVFVVEDTENDVRFAKNPLVTGFAGIRFYAGAPITTPAGRRIGTVAVMDTAPHTPPPEHSHQLEHLAAIVMEALAQQGNQNRLGHALDLPLNRTNATTVALDANGTILQARENWTAICGHEKCDEKSKLTPGLHYRDAALLPDCVDDPHVDRQVRNGIRAVLEDETADVDLAYSCFGDDHERLVEVRVTAMDHPRVQALVTHRKATVLKEQQQRRRLLETAVDQAQEVILITEGAPLDEPGPRITYVNPAFTAVTGYEPDEIIGKTPRVLQGPLTESWVLDELREHAERGIPWEGEVINYRKDGTPYVNHWAMAPVRDDDETLTHWVSVQRDVTETYQTEKRLLQAQEQERKRVARTMHDEMGGLLASLQMAIDASQPNAPDASSSLDDVRRLASDLSGMVRRLTEQLHSRILEDYGLSRALPRLVDRFREQHGLDVEIQSDRSPDVSLPPLVEKTAYRGIQEALENVVQHAETEQVQIVAEQEPQTLRLHVIDEGDGFYPEDELDDGDKLGLASLNERINRLNGRLNVDAAPGAGTRVSMTLPLELFPIQEHDDPQSSNPDP